MTQHAKSGRASIRKGFLLAGAVLAAGLAASVVTTALGHTGHGPRHRTSAPMRAPNLPPELAAVRDALAKYQDPRVAIRDGYLSTLGCVEYPVGGMGVHFINPTLIGPTPDPMRPQILVYEPGPRGSLRLVAAEWFIPLATGVAGRPTLFDRPFDGPMEGHEPLMPRELHHYDLHVWLWKENPAGLFNATNPGVGCAGHPYALMEQPTAIVTHAHPAPATR
ncbi:hypothetical protein GXW74_11995 [Roseomonas eburnea]|uniref:Uncharacterized protein n=1 Tax=Neoroseomonas eburnea TaxID=1346889 RepID=A0A9X9XBX1_9PROT|nr:hypothetical protein [Neoroseomonas eburnea]MBR0681207.1 hypothetical protein [Neoroseomonas eburnea]